MYPLTIVLLIFDLLSFCLAGWMYIEGSDAALSRVFSMCCGFRSLEEQEVDMGWAALERWQREQWTHMDAAEAASEVEEEEEELVVEWRLTDEERIAWQRHHAVQAEMRRYGFT
ncbi:hypothetical protein DM02DRAFT_614277 [Periconia macrospinosa]|uniref:Uncharacterized protein n=1 Tax=Periconia macrospinosa TaxID=97972 RepID=A0A2V1DTA7_9PLEO|nr:hypothetical protein DM02DRAFT_614277 [Periconia macrospinosa]